MQFKVPLRRKDKEIETTPCVVEKTIELNGREYARFSQNLLDDHDFILENRKSMYVDTEGVSHCLLVLGEGSDDGILVESEGSSYAHYSAYVPHARTLVQMDQYPVLQEFNNQMMKNAGKYVEQAVENQKNGICRISLEDMQWELEPEMFESQLLTAMLEERPEFSDVDEGDEELILRLKPEYLPAEEKQRTRISQEQADIMCARHTLWLHDEGGAQADFSGCELADLDLSHRNLNNALFDGAFLCGTEFDHSELCFASFDGAVLYDCAMKNVCAEEASFKSTGFEECSLYGAVMTHSNFSGAKFTKTELHSAILKNCCMTVRGLKEAIQGRQIWNTAVITDRIGANPPVLFFLCEGRQIMSGKVKSLYGVYKAMGRDAFLEAAKSYSGHVQNTVEATLAEMESRWYDAGQTMTEADKMVDDFRKGQIEWNKEDISLLAQPELRM